MDAPWKIDEVIWVDTADDNTPTGRDGFPLKLVTTPYLADGWMSQWWVTGWEINKTTGAAVRLRTVCVPTGAYVWQPETKTWIEPDLVGTSTRLPFDAPGRLQVESR